MRDEKDRLINLRESHKASLQRTEEILGVFLGTHCRYRNDNATCGHGRFNMKKYPQHVPTPQDCDPTMCPRN